MSSGASDSAPGGRRVLLIGLDPAVVDFSNLPFDEAMLRARIAVGDAEVAAAGYAAVSCQIGVDPAEGEAEVRAHLALGPWDAVMIGGGIRANPAHTELFERVVNAVHEVAPGARFAFNAGPDTTLAALRRVLSDR